MLAPATTILEAVDLVKVHRGEVHAVRGISLQIPTASCFGLLGPNGAGKTTTIEMLEGILPPTQGRVLFKGKPLATEFRERAGIQFQSTALPQFLTCREALRLFASLYQRCLTVEELADLCALQEFLDRDTAKISGGQRQRLLLAIALVNDPEVLFLDEPTTGLDPQSRHSFWELINSIKARGTTIILTTHYMEEAYRLCDELVIMDHGEILVRGTPNDLLAQHFGRSVISLPRADMPQLDEVIAGTRIDHDATVEIHTADITLVMQQLLCAGGSLQRLVIRQPTLEDLFLAITGKQLRA